MDAAGLNDVSSLAKYQLWGGLPTAIASTDDFKSALQTDAAIARTFDILDRLMSCQGPTLAFVVAVFKGTGLTAHEINRLASPLLEGIWVALAGRPVNAYIHSRLAYDVFVPPNMALVLSRMITRRRCYLEAMDWLLQRCSDLRRCTDDAIIRAAATGQEGAIELLLRYHSAVKPLQTACIAAGCRIAATNGHLAVLRLLLPIAQKQHPARIFEGAVRNQHVSVAEFLLPSVPPIFVDMHHNAAVEGGCDRIVRTMMLVLELDPDGPRLCNEEQVRTAVKLGRIPLVLQSLVELKSTGHRTYSTILESAVRASLRFQRFELLQAMFELQLDIASVDGLAILLAPHHNAVVLGLLTAHTCAALDVALGRLASSAIIISMIHGHVPMVAAWLQYQQANVRGNFDSLCYIAAAAGSMPLMQLICAAADKSLDSVAPGGEFTMVIRNGAGHSAILHMDALKAAIRHRHTAVLSTLLERVTVQSSRMDALILALEVADVDTVRLVAMSCADFEPKGFVHSDSILRITRLGNSDVVAVLVQYCPRLLTSEHLTPGRFLSAAVESNSEGLLDLVLTRLKLRGDIAFDQAHALSCQQTGLALHRAAAMGNNALCTRLIQFMLAIWSDEAVVPRLAATFPPAGVEVPLDFVEIHRILLEHELVNLEDETAALPFAARYGQLEMCMFLVEHGADVQTDLNAPLKLAHRHKHPAVVEYLLSQGAPACLMEEGLFS